MGFSIRIPNTLLALFGRASYGHPYIASKYQLAGHQVYPQGDLLRPKFIIEPTRQDIRILRNTPLASMGSCFAAEIKWALKREGFNYVQTETNAWSEHSSCAWERVYTTRNALQIVQYSLHETIQEGRIEKSKDSWRDLFRYRVAYSSHEHAVEDIKQHMKLSNEAIQKSSHFIFTLGQNEAWYSKDHDFYYSQKPTSVNPERIELRQFNVEENVAALEQFYATLHAINPDLKLILSLSPVPSTATFFDENVVVRSLLNKAILRVAIDDFLKKHPEIVYFPSYEIVNTWKNNPFLPDNLHIKRNVVNSIVRSFLKCYGGE